MCFKCVRYLILWLEIIYSLAKIHTGKVDDRRYLLFVALFIVFVFIYAFLVIFGVFQVPNFINVKNDNNAPCLYSALHQNRPQSV